MNTSQDIGELIEELSDFFTEKNKFFEIMRLRGEIRRLFSDEKDYDRALRSAERILQEIKDTETRNGGKNLQLIVHNSSAFYEDDMINIGGIIEWDNYGPIKSLKEARRCINYFLNNRGIESETAKKRIEAYIAAMTEERKNIERKKYERVERVADLILEINPTDFMAKIQRFNSKWKGLFLYSNATDIPINQITNPTYLNPFLDMKAEVEADINLERKSEVELYLTQDVGDIVDELVRGIFAENREYTVKVSLFSHSGGQLDQEHMPPFRVDGVIPYQEMLARADGLVPDCVDIQIVDEFRSEIVARVYIELNDLKHYKKPMLISYDHNFDLFSQNIRRLQRFFSRNQ